MQLEQDRGARRAEAPADQALQTASREAPAFWCNPASQPPAADSHRRELGCMARRGLTAAPSKNAGLAGPVVPTAAGPGRLFVTSSHGFRERGRQPGCTEAGLSSGATLSRKGARDYRPATAPGALSVWSPTTAPPPTGRDLPGSSSRLDDLQTLRRPVKAALALKAREGS